MNIQVEKVGNFQSFIVTGEKKYELLWEFINGSMNGVHLIDDFLSQYKNLDLEGELCWGGNSGEIFISDNNVKIVPTYNENMFLEVPLRDFIGYLNQLRLFILDNKNK